MAVKRALVSLAAVLQEAAHHTGAQAAPYTHIRGAPQEKFRINGHLAYMRPVHPWNMIYPLRNGAEGCNDGNDYLTGDDYDDPASGEDIMNGGSGIDDMQGRAGA